MTCILRLGCSYVALMKQASALWRDRFAIRLSPGSTRILTSGYPCRSVFVGALLGWTATENQKSTFPTGRRRRS